VDNLWWPADLDGFNLMDLASVVLSTEAVHQMDRMKQGMHLDDEHLMHDLIVKMRFEGKYLSERSTRKYFRQEHLMPDLFPRQTYESWEAKGRSEEEIALARVRELVASHEPPDVAPEVRRELERIMAAAEAALVP
jgi:trimethylamine:corrinoid methyltransferase-like protein